MRPLQSIPECRTSALIIIINKNRLHYNLMNLNTNISTSKKKVVISK